MRMAARYQNLSPAYLSNAVNLGSKTCVSRGDFVFAGNRLFEPSEVVYFQKTRRLFSRKILVGVPGGIRTRVIAVKEV